MRVAYFDVFAGASGDMILGALLDAGASVSEIVEQLNSLGIDGWTLEAVPDSRGALGGTRAVVSVDPAVQQPVRNYPHIAAAIDLSGLSSRTKVQAKRVFLRLAEAEAKVHRAPVQSVHFHEVGAVDSIVDVVGALVGLEQLGIEHVCVSSIPLGGGLVNTQHGLIPVPAPATLELLAAAGAPTRPSTGSAAGKEMVTPTAAALFAALGEFRQPALRVEGTGYGIGGRTLPDVPNVLRLWFGEETLPPTVGLQLIETNIDDSTPEILGYVLQRLLDAGAKDVWFTPIQMKKNRPGTMLSAIAEEAYELAVSRVMLTETSTFGVRRQPITRREADRELVTVPVLGGTARAKIKRLDGNVAGVSPEFDDCRLLADQHGVPLAEIYRLVERAARELL